MTAQSSPGRGEGFTVLELMITVFTATVILMLAVPAFLTILQKNRVSSAAEQLYVSLAEARGEALKRRDSVRVCPWVGTGNPSCRNDGDWSEGWVIFHDVDSDGSPDAGEIIKAVPGTSLASGLSLGGDANVEDFVEFGATGATLDSGTTGVFQFCHTGLDVYWREIGISASGRIEDNIYRLNCGDTGGG